MHIKCLLRESNPDTVIHTYAYTYAYVWVTVSGFDSRRRHFISVFNQPPRSTQPSTVRGTVNEYQPKGGDALRLGR